MRIAEVHCIKSVTILQSGLRVPTNILYNIVAEWILDKSDRIGSNLVNKINLLRRRSMVDAALENAAAMAVGTDGNTVGSNSVVDEL